MCITKHIKRKENNQNKNCLTVKILLLTFIVSSNIKNNKNNLLNFITQFLYVIEKLTKLKIKPKSTAFS